MLLLTSLAALGLKNMSLYFQKKIGKPLTSRELEVLRLITQGKSNAKIAKYLFISIDIVKLDVRSILHKMAVNGRVQAAVKAVKDGLV